MDAEEAGRALARRHGADPATEVDAEHSLLNYPEAPHAGLWTLRSALVRLAQPAPVEASDLLQVMRRLDAALHHVARDLERHPVMCDRGLIAGAIGEPPADAVADIRTADLARLVAAGLDEHALVVGYESVPPVVPLGPAERRAVPLLSIAVGFDRLAVDLAAWADAGPEDPPIEAVHRVAGAALARLDELGVPEETGPPPGYRAGRRR